ncbi:hypothetical protein [Shewanella sp. MEBiC00475]|uniref:hypothetical protein n=1 Tax=Shewanella sp. MEBiC00475 TaxID=2575361 RepID=UPI0010BF7B8F|nr:hypothetical protein [Shewanella sp. MEBiC00475]
MENHFANYQIAIPAKFQEKIKKYCRTGGTSVDTFNAPFKRQVDFWFVALCIAFKEGLIKEKVKDTYNATTAAILSNDSYRIHLMYLIALAEIKDENILTDSKAVFDICSEYANAGIPYLIELLDDPDQKPLWNIYDYLEA